MSDFSHERADSALADALWWFRGYSAARPADSRDQTYGLDDKLRTARNWLKDLARGERRMIGLHERELGIVLTEGEFEMVFDALRHPSPKEEIDMVVARLRRAFEQFNVERSALREDPDIPF